MRCVIVVPVHRRKALTHIWGLYMSGILPANWLLVPVGGDPDHGGLHTWEAPCCSHVRQPNRPLSLKVQAGIVYARGFDPDVVMTSGSDDFPDGKLLLGIYDWIAGGGADFVSVRDMRIWDASDGQGYAWRGYTRGRGHGS